MGFDTLYILTNNFFLSAQYNIFYVEWAFSLYLQVMLCNTHSNLRIWMCVNRDFQPIYTIIQYALIGCILVFLLIIKSKRDVFDEFAKETLYKTDSICLKISYVIMGLILIPTAFITPEGIMMGYLIAGGIVVLTITRAIIFCVVDKRGI